MATLKDAFNKNKAFLEKTLDTVKELQQNAEEDSNLAHTTAMVVKAVEGLDHALEVADTDEKMAFLVDATTKYTTNVAFMLLDARKFEEFTKDYYNLPFTTAQSAELCLPYMKETKKQEDKLNAMRDEFLAKEKEMQIFQSIVAGYTEEEAEQRINQYNQQMAQRMGQ